MLFGGFLRSQLQRAEREEDSLKRRRARGPEQNGPPAEAWLQVPCLDAPHPPPPPSSPPHPVARNHQQLNSDSCVRVRVLT